MHDTLHVTACIGPKGITSLPHDDVIKWKHFPRNWPFVRGIHWSPVNSSHKGQWRRALMFSLICVWINDWVNNRETGDLRRYRAHYDVIVMPMSNVHMQKSMDSFYIFLRLKRIKILLYDHPFNASLYQSPWFFAELIYMETLANISEACGQTGRRRTMWIGKEIKEVQIELFRPCPIYTKQQEKGSTSTISGRWLNYRMPSQCQEMWRPSSSIPSSALTSCTTSWRHCRWRGKLFTHDHWRHITAMASQIATDSTVFQPFLQMHTKENTKSPRYWPFCEESTAWFPHKEPVTRKSSCDYVI